MSELKPCPFCGGKPEKIYKSTGQTTHIECPDCHAQFPKSTNENKYDDEWNRRHVDTCTMEFATKGMMRSWWVCSNCGKAMDTIEACGGRKPPKFCGNCGAKVVRE